MVHGKGDQGAHQAQEGEHYDEEDSQTVEAVHERSALPVARVASHHRRWHHLQPHHPRRESWVGLARASNHKGGTYTT